MLAGSVHCLLVLSRVAGWVVSSVGWPAPVLGWLGQFFAVALVYERKLIIDVVSFDVCVVFICSTD